MTQAIKRVAAALLVLASSCAVAGDSADKLTMNVDLSEWTPSQTLELDLISGKYVVTPPIAGWPKNFPMRPRYTGQIGGEVLKKVRLLSARAFASGVNDTNCDLNLPGGIPPVPSNAVGPDEFTLVKDRRAIKSESIYCLTNEARAFYRFVTALFDHERP